MASRLGIPDFDKPSRNFFKPIVEVDFREIWSSPLKLSTLILFRFASHRHFQVRRRFLIEDKRVGSVSKFITTVASIRDQWASQKKAFFDPWFRGQTNASWGLTPSIYVRKLQGDEEAIRADFIRRAAQLTVGRVPSSEWGWYFLMQHYRCPTRLLDWTDSALVALFFAINSNDPSDLEVKTDAAVWMLDPWWLNKAVLGHSTVVDSDWPEAKPYLPPIYKNLRLRKRHPIAIDPPHVAPRVAVQRSRFTIHGTVPNGLEAVAGQKKAGLVRITIPKRAIISMRLDLQTCGVTDTTLFPDLEGLSRDLVRYWQSEWWWYYE